MKKILLSFVFILFAIVTFSQSKWKEFLYEMHPYEELRADFGLTQSFPYNHKIKPLLTVPSSGNIILDIVEGQILNKESIKIQFGYTGDITEWKIRLPEDGSSNYIIITNERDFKKRLRESTSMRISILLYQNGIQTIYFTTKGFKL